MLDFWEGLRPDAWENFWTRTAVICRYGHTGYEGALRMPLAEANAFGEAINRILEEEKDSVPTND